MNLSNNTVTCDEYHTAVENVSDTGELICLCRAGFTGNLCETRISWYGPASLPVIK